MLKQLLLARLAIAAGLSMSAATLAIAGDLNPPAGAVAPTMKTLSEVEPRIALNATNTPGGSSSVFKITQPGSYYLTGNVTGVAGKHGIEIVSGNVSLDLMGYALAGVGGSLNGIAATAAAPRNITIRNGVVRNWGGSGVETASFVARNVVVENITADTNASYGIFVFEGTSIVDCTASGNSAVGIITGEGCSMTRCIVRSNSGGGIVVGRGSIVADCTATSNPGGGIFTFQGSGRSIIRGCTADANGDDGINVVFGSLVTGCTVTNNAGDGIEAATMCSVIGNNAYNNGTVDGAGIHVFNGGTRIEGNNVVLNDRGIDVDDANNLIIRNSASFNTTEYDIAGGNTAGPIVTSADIGTSNNPSANYDF